MKTAITPIAAYSRDLRRRLHRHPELSGEEFSTRDVVVAELKALGFTPRTFADHTGVVAIWPAAEGAAGHHLTVPAADGVAGQNLTVPAADGVAGPGLALRADMDALPLREASGVPWASEIDGVMHACGHDGHTAVLLGVARWLVESGRKYAGPITLIFQPAEESGLGAPAMIRDGVLDNPPVEAVFALHGWPEIPVGTFAVPDGAIMAAVDNFDLTLKGVGGHGAMPHLVRDPVPAAAALISAAQTLVSRRTSPLEAAVLTFGNVAAGKTYNVIPETALLRGTLRTLDPKLRETLRADLETLIAHTAAAHGIESSIDWVEACPATINDPAMAGLARDGIRAVLGDECVLDKPPSMGGEDFAYFLQKRPGAYFWLGLGMERGGLHNPRFDFNDEAIAAGITAFAGIVERFYDPSRPHPV